MSDAGEPRPRQTLSELLEGLHELARLDQPGQLASLRERVARGDAAALTELVGRHTEFAAQAALLLAPDSIDPFDAIQEAIIVIQNVLRERHGTLNLGAFEERLLAAFKRPPQGRPPDQGP